MRNPFTRLLLLSLIVCLIGLLSLLSGQQVEEGGALVVAEESTEPPIQPEASVPAPILNLQAEEATASLESSQEKAATEDEKQPEEAIGNIDTTGLKNPESFIVSEAEAAQLNFDDIRKENQEDIEAFLETHGRTLFAAGVPHFGTMFWGWFVLWMIIVAVAYFAAAFACAQLLIPKGTQQKLLRVGAYAGVNAIVYAIVAVIIYFVFINVTTRIPVSGDDLLPLLAWVVLFQVVIFSVMAPTAIVAFDVTGGKAFVFAIVFYGASSASIISLPVVLPMFKASNKAAASAMLEDWTPILQGQIEEERERLARLASTGADAGQVAAVLNGIRVTEQEVKQLELKLADRKESPAMLFASIGRLVDEGKYDEARRQYSAFTERYPDDELTLFAERMADRMNRREQQATLEKEAAERKAAAEEAQRKAELQRKIQTSDITLEELRAAIVGKNRDEVRAILGEPDRIASNKFIYLRNRQVTDFINRRKRGFFVFFEVGICKSLGYQ